MLWMWVLVPQGEALWILSLRGEGSLPMCSLYIHPERKPAGWYPLTHRELLISYCSLTIYPNMLRLNVSSILSHDYWLAHLNRTQLDNSSDVNDIVR